MTVALLLQLTDEEMLFAQRINPAMQQVSTEQKAQAAPAVPAEDPATAPWPDADDSAC